MISWYFPKKSFTVKIDAPDFRDAKSMARARVAQMIAETPLLNRRANMIIIDEIAPPEQTPEQREKLMKFFGYFRPRPDHNSKFMYSPDEGGE